MTVTKRLVLLACAVLIGCNTDVVDVPQLPEVAGPRRPDVLPLFDEQHDSDDSDDAARFGDWAEPVNLGAVVNSEVEELAPFITKDALSLYFGSPRSGGLGAVDIWVSRRSHVGQAWGTPQNLGPTINSASADNGVAIAPSGRVMIFQSGRSGGIGGNDLYMSRRRNKRDDFAWEPPVNLGSVVNSTANEAGATLFEDEERETLIMYFHSNRAGGQGESEIYASTMQPDGTFGPPERVVELNSPGNDQAPSVRRDGLEVYLGSDRAGTLGGMDIWVATRPSVAAPWSTPINLGAGINTVNFDLAPALSFKGTELYFHSALRPGNVGPEHRFDLWVSMRGKVRDPDDDDDDDEGRD